MINPIAFHVGSWPVYWYGILISSAMVIGVLLVSYLAKRDNLDPDSVIGVVLIAIALGVIGARLYYVVMQWGYYSNHLIEIPMIWKKGLAIHGGILGGFIGCIIGCNIYKLNFWRVADIMAPAVILGQAIGRWGNFFNQEAFGYVTTVPWAMMIRGEMRHPTFLYESIWDIIIFIILITWIISNRKRQTGTILLSYLGMYSLGRVFIEGFRTDSLMFMGFRAAQLISIVLILVSIATLYYRHKHYDINGAKLISNSMNNNSNNKKKNSNKKSKARKS